LLIEILFETVETWIEVAKDIWDGLVVKVKLFFLAGWA
jgi:hypothetical protein